MKLIQHFKVNTENCIKIFAFFILLTSLQTSDVLSQAYPYKFKYLTVDEGLSHTDANDIAQDRLGYIWIATYFGLDRFDGYTINKYYNDNEPLNNAFKNRLRCIYPDNDGNIWLSSEGGIQCFDVRSEKYIDYSEKGKVNPAIEKIYKPAGNLLYGLVGDRIKVYLIKGHSLVEQRVILPVNIQCSSMAVDNDSQIYFSSNQGIWLLNKKKQAEKVAVSNLKTQIVSSIFFDKRNNLLISCNSQAYLTVRGTVGGKQFAVVKQFSCPSNSNIKDILEDSKSDYWINDGSNLLRLNKEFKLIQTLSSGIAMHNFNSNSLTKMFIDRSQCLWACTFGGGVNYCDLNEKLFYTLQHNPEFPNSLAGNHIRSVLDDGDNLWIGTTADGLNLYDIKTSKFSYYNNYNSPVRLKNNTISSLTFDNDHNLWIGSSAGVDVLRVDGKKLLRPPGCDKFPQYPIDTFVKDCYGNIWFGNHMNKFGVIWKDDKDYYHVKYYGEGFFILPDKNSPQLFISSTHGLKRLIIDKQGNIIKTFTYHASSQPNSLSSDYTYPIRKQNDSTYWIGTIGGGLDRLSLSSNDAYNIKHFGSSYGVFNDVESLEIDDVGNIWMGGNGLECFNPKTGKLIRYDKNDGLQGNSFKVGASCKGADGRLYFGGINGLNYFYPDQIRTNSIAAQPILTDILVNNQKPKLGQPDSTKYAISQAISYSKKLTLSYLQNNFVIFFSSMHFANPLKCQYRYRLVGFDKDWRYTNGKNPSAAYSNLDYSKYPFILQATNNDGIWSDSTTGISIVITPPWWKSNVAKMIYFLLFLAGITGIYIYQGRWYRLKREIEVNAVNEKKREEMHHQREELYQQQLMFFTNISHEFRTPLTLILGPLEGLISQNSNVELDSSYQLILRNAKRLINLVSELMNFKKVADSVIKLQVQPLAINQFCRDLANEFENLATGKEIKFEFINNTGIVDGDMLSSAFDVQILEKILFNLLNNAFKYTNVGGYVSFETFFDLSNFEPSFKNGFQLLNETYRAEKYIYFRVADSGIGISAESITRIFDRYYRISTNHLGSGVGLALVKSLTQLHKGDIYVFSERYKGTEIIIGIPWGEDNYEDSDKATSGQKPESQLEPIDNSILSPVVQQQDNIHPVSAKIKKHILLVDDNQELRFFLKQTFEKNYHIYEAEDGFIGVEIASEKIPDLIISDVMMPGMNGIEFCKIIKEQFETRHIPFIILSAKDALDTKIEGMESGADFYFAKPLSIDLLSLTIHNIFEQSEKLKERYTNNYLSEATELVHSEKDKEFFNKLVNLIEDNIQDPDLDVEFLCDHLYLSRTKLYQKIKSISDQSVGEFIRTIRLKKSIQIMTHEDVAMNEVADRVGLQSGSNFSRSFKKEYGKSPLQFMQSLKKTNGN